MKTNPISGERIKSLFEIRIRRFFDFRYKLAILNSKRSANKYADQFEQFLIKQIESDNLNDFYKEIAGANIINSRIKNAKDIKSLDHLKWKHSRGL